MNTTQNRTIEDIEAALTQLDQRGGELLLEAEGLLAQIAKGGDTAKLSARRSDILQQIEGLEITRLQLQHEWRQAKIAAFMPIWDGYCKDYAEITQNIAQLEAELERLAKLRAAALAAHSMAKSRVGLVHSRLLHGAGKAKLLDYDPSASFAGELQAIAAKHGVDKDLVPSVYRGELGR